MISSLFSVLALALGLAAVPASDSETFAGLVVDQDLVSTKVFVVQQVINGDEIRVEASRGSLTVRLLNISTQHAEMGATARTASVATHYLRSLLIGRKVRLAFEAGLKAGEADHVLAYVLVGQGKVVNVEMVRRGYSPYYFRHGYSGRFHHEFVTAESEAFGATQNLWNAAESRQRLWSLRQEWAAALGGPPPRLGLGSPTHGIGWLARDLTDDALAGAIVVLLLVLMGITKANKRITSATWPGQPALEGEERNSTFLRRFKVALSRRTLL